MSHAKGVARRCAPLNFIIHFEYLSTCYAGELGLLRKISLRKTEQKKS